MKKKNLRPLILSSLAALATAGIGTGATFALFTDKAETTIQVEAGKVDVSTSISDLEFFELGSAEKITATDAEGALVNSIGGTAKIDGSTLALGKWTPGNKVKFKLTVRNKSNVEIKTRFVETHSHNENKTDLYPALKISYASSDADFMRWREKPASTNLEEGEVITTIDVTVEFPNHGIEVTANTEGRDNAYQDAQCQIVFSQEAVQGNADVVSLVDTLNGVLAEQTIANPTLHDALGDVANLANASTLQTNGIVWNSSDDRFYLIPEINDDPIDYFMVYNSMPVDQLYSIYASDAWSTAVIDDLTVGFDAGDVTSINEITYRHLTGTPQTVTIRTNGGTLNIYGMPDSGNVHGDTILHYGTAEVVNEYSCGSHSYDEYGLVTGNIYTHDGHVHVKADTTGVDGASAAAVVVVTSAPKITIDNSTPIVFASTLSGEAIETVLEKVSVKGETLEADEIETIDVTTAGSFAGGAGTKESPFIISKMSQWEYLQRDATLRLQDKYFKITTDLDFASNPSKATLSTFKGHLDFTGHKVENVPTGGYGSLINVFRGGSISNLDYYLYSTNVDNVNKLVFYVCESADFVGINTYGIHKVSDNNSGILFYSGNGLDNATINIIDCTNYATIINSNGYSAVFAGGFHYGSGTQTLNFKNVVNRGNLYGYGAQPAVMLLANANYHTVNINIDSCVNYGTILGGQTHTDMACANLIGNVNVNGAVVNQGTYGLLNAMTFPVQNEKYVLPVVEGATSYTLVFSFSDIPGTNGGIISKSITLTTDQLNDVYAYNWIGRLELDEEEQAAILPVEIGDGSFSIANGKYVFTEKEQKLLGVQPSVCLQAYGANGDLINVFYQAGTNESLGA